MSPQFTEAWGTTYLQIIITLLIFAFGIPALSFQLIVPEEIRNILFRHIKINKRLIFTIVFILWSIVILFLFTLVFIWYLHPSPGSILPPWKHLTAGSLITIALIFTILCWLFSLWKFSRKRVINDLERNLWKEFSKSGTLSEEIIIDLISIGEISEAGHRKELVLNAVNRLVQKVQTIERYTGCELEELMRNFVKILANREKPGNEDNYLLAVKILGNALSRLYQHKNFTSLDVNLVLRALERLGKASVELGYDNTPQIILEIAISDTNAFYQIGLSALKYKRFLVAVATLNRLEALALEKLPLTMEEGSNLLGLIAHFWTYGASTKRRAKSFIELNKNNFAPSFKECLNYAIEYHYSVAQFDTADKLIIMLNEIKRKK